MGRRRIWLAEDHSPAAPGIEAAAQPSKSHDRWKASSDRYRSAAHARAGRGNAISGANHLPRPRLSCTALDGNYTLSGGSLNPGALALRRTRPPGNPYCCFGCRGCCCCARPRGDSGIVVRHAEQREGRHGPPRRPTGSRSRRQARKQAWTQFTQSGALNRRARLIPKELRPPSARLF